MDNEYLRVVFNEDYKRSVRDTVINGGNLNKFSFGLDKTLEFAGLKLWRSEVINELTNSWDDDESKVEGVRIDYVEGDILFESTGLVKNEEILSKYLAKSITEKNVFETVLLSTLELDRNVQRYNNFINAYREIDTKTLLTWKNSLENATEPTLNTEIKLVIVNAEIEARKIQNRVKKIIVTRYNKLKSELYTKRVVRNIIRA